MMGRTKRIRYRRRCFTDQEAISLGHDDKLQQLLQWMKHNGWAETCKLTPSIFPSTGRGIQALQHIAAGDILANVPGKLLMTVETASNSMFSWFFKRRTYLTQQVLAIHLIFEKHIGNISFWEKYINTLPENVATPVFTSCAEINSLPTELSSKVNSFQKNVTELFNEVTESIYSVDKCPHCDCCISQLISVDCFLWAWFIINSRAVYISPEHNSNHNLILSDSNCLALAPYLDLFNHSNNAKVQAFVSETDGSYRIRTSGSYKRFSEVYIHYGDHSNEKLYLEYGFILSGNVYDTLSLAFDDVCSTVIKSQGRGNIPKTTYKFLKSHDLLTNTYLSSDGMSWSTKVLIYVLLFSENVDPKTIQLKVYSNNFDDSEIIEIFNIGKLLVDDKRIQINTFIQEMNETKCVNLSGNVSGSFSLAIDLYNEYLNILCNCERSLTIKV